MFGGTREFWARTEQPAQEAYRERKRLEQRVGPGSIMIDPGIVTKHISPLYLPKQPVGGLTKPFSLKIKDVFAKKEFEVTPPIQVKKSILSVENITKYLPYFLIAGLGLVMVSKK